MSEQVLELSAIRTDGETQPRVAIDPAVVQEYADALQAGAEFPSVTVVHDGATYWLVDGFHRFFAHRRLNRTQIKAEVLTGELAEARWLSLGANKTHGVRRTNPDKVNAVRRALKLRSDMSDRGIAEHVGVSHSMVATHRAALTATVNRLQSASSQSPGPVAKNAAAIPRIGRDGRAINTARIGRGRRRRGHPGISPKAYKPVRTGAAPQPMTALSMPHDPTMGARTLIELFSADYLRALVAFLTQHLEGAPS